MTICSGHGLEQLEAGDQEDLKERPGERGKRYGQR